MTNFVLVHGSWMGGWQWQPVRERLETAGHRVLAPSLTGMSDRHHIVSETTSLATHIDDIARLIEWERLEDVVLVGHSYGGMVITGAAARDARRIAHLVYLDAFLPRPDESAWDILPWQRDAFEPLRRADRPWLVDPVDTAVFFPELGAAFDPSRMTPMPISTHQDPIRAAPTPGAIPGTYVHCTAPSFFDDSATRAAHDGMNVIDVTAGHQVLTSHPDTVANILTTIANAIGRNP